MPPITIDPGLATIIVAVAIGLGGIISWFITQRRIGRTELDIKVNEKVDAKIGSILLSLTQLEGEARTQLVTFSKELETKQQTLTDDIATKEVKLKEIVDSATNQAQVMQELINRAGELLPQIETAGVVPGQLLHRARGTSDSSELLALLLRILDHADSDSKVLEFAGDIARGKLENRRLAEKLYERAMREDSDNISCKSEYLHLMAYRVDARTNAQKEIIALAKQFPNQRVVLGNTMNFFVQIDDYESMIKVAEELLPISDQKSLLHRNIAIAKSKLGYSNEEVTGAYEQAFKSADQHDFANTARPYILYLVDQEDFATAETTLIRALRYNPSASSLHRLRGDIYMRQDKLDEAESAYKLAAGLGDHDEQFMAERKIRDIELLRLLNLPKMGDQPSLTTPAPAL